MISPWKHNDSMVLWRSGGSFVICVTEPGVRDEVWTEVEVPDLIEVRRARGTEKLRDASDAMSGIGRCLLLSLYERSEVRVVEDRV